MRICRNQTKSTDNFKKTKFLEFKDNLKKKKLVGSGMELLSFDE